MLRKTLKTLFFFSFIFSAQAKLEDQIKNGDIIFIRSKSSQSKALEEVTGSIWTHMGILLKVKNYPTNKTLVDNADEGVWVVAHSGGPVRLDPLNVFIGSGSKTAVKRLRSGVSFEQAKKIFKEAKPYIEKQTAYDLYFTKAAGYCSGYVDLVIEKALKISLANPVLIGDLKLNGPEAQKIISQRFSSKAEAPFTVDSWKNKTTVTPVSIFKSELLTDI